MLGEALSFWVLKAEMVLIGWDLQKMELSGLVVSDDNGWRIMSYHVKTVRHSLVIDGSSLSQFSSYLSTLGYGRSRSATASRSKEKNGQLT
ncbi:uncharacterized protein RAG0_11133 [Rhynchosporium agropyri]|uniref:Uncharacterized protein n=1 Tax=Rhynchosporium agropyri TaxID=914238 RepID=A0A1E1L5B7_9HELO|nr:uncharacterized protein RAG0_11133 [Rhynchosporium agropyri]